jgi:crotonobetainyl-CoA:carnitine CoA-transferase CaiB-like acyl-CoA transferase
MDALDGITVLDLTSQIAGPYATKLLADLGARVIKVERPGGDPSRKLGPFLHDEPGPERSATFQFLNTNKESVVLDLVRPEARQAVYDLLPRVDLAVTGFAPATAEQLGMGPETLRAHADVPVLAITNFGRSGPYRDYRLSETVLFAMGGEMFSHGTADREPLKLGGTAALLQCGAMGGVAALGAIHAWELHRAGQVVDMALFDVQINNIDRRSSAILGFRWSGRVNMRPAGGGQGVVGGIYPVADGYVEVTATFGSYWQRFVEMIDDDALRDSKWLNPAWMLDPAAKEEADGIVYPWMLSRTRAEIWEAARRARAMVAPLYTAEDLFNDPVLRERGLWTEIEHQVLGRLPMLGRPYVLERTPWRIRRPAPTLGEHTEAVLRELGYDSATIARIAAEPIPD